MKDDMTKKTGIGQLLIHYLEYVLVFTMIAECNSYYHYAISNRPSPVSKAMIFLCVFFTATTIVLYCFENKELVVKAFRDIAPVLLTLLFLLVVFFFCNVARLCNKNEIYNYTLNFLFLLPLMLILFRVNKENGNIFDLFYKHSNIICILSLANLIIYTAVTINPDVVSCQILKTRWSDNGYIRTIHNYLNLCTFFPASTRNIAGILINRNQGFYTEPLMFCIQLITALYTELFLSEKKEPKVWRCIVLLLVIFTTQSTLGIMIAVLACGLKVLDICHTWKRRGLVPFIGAAVLIILIMLIRQKSNLSGTFRYSSFRVHIDDYVLALKAFLRRPVFGWGYDKASSIQAFMTPERFEANRGLSNSVAVVFAEGGFWLGAICLFPFLVHLYHVKSANYRLSFWGIGPLCLYCLTIFHFHPFLIFFIALGYATINIEYKKKQIGIAIRLIEPSTFFVVQEKAENIFYHVYGNLKHSLPGVLGAALMVFVLSTSRQAWTLLDTLLCSYQLYLGNSSWKVYYATLFIILCFVLLSSSIKTCKHYDHSVRREWNDTILLSLGYSIIFVVFYPVIYSYINSIIASVSLNNDLIESSLLAGILFGGIIICWFVNRCYRRFIHRDQRFIGLVISISICVAGIGCVLEAGSRLLINVDEKTEEIGEVLQTVVKASSGTVYANDNAVAFKKMIPQIGFSAARDEGFSVQDNVSVIMKHDQNCQDLFDSGFEIAEISPEYVIYSNDDMVINCFKDSEYSFSKYYHFVRTIDLHELAEINNLHYSAGKVYLGGSKASIAKGPNDYLRSGRYTLSLSIDALDVPSSAKGSRKIGTITVSSRNGNDVVVVRDLFNDEFNNNGKALKNIVFQVGDAEGVEYKVQIDDDYQVALESLDIKESPEYVSKKTMNGKKQIIKEMFYYLDNTPYCMQNGYYGIERKYDRVGNIVVQKYLDEYGLPIITTMGFAEVHRRFNRTNRLIQESYYGVNSEPISLPDGYHMYQLEYDSSNNVSRQVFCDPTGAPIVTSLGYAEIRKQYNDDRQAIQESYYDEKQKPCKRVEGYSVYEKAYDDRGNVIEQRFCDEAGNLTQTVFGYSGFVRKFDDSNRLIFEYYYGIDQKPIMRPQGYYFTTMSYDKDGNISLQKYYDENGNPIITSFGYAEIHKEYDNNKRVTRESYFGRDGKPVMRLQGYCATSMEYDENGNIVVQKYYGTDGNPIITSFGYAEIHKEYNESNQATKESYFGKDGRIITRPQGYCAITMDYDKDGNISVQKYFNEYGSRVLTSSGFAEVHKDYNEKHQIICERYYGLYSEPITRVEGYSIIEKEYNDAGDVVVQKYFNENNNPVITSFGYAEIHKEYNVKHQIIRESYYDVEGNPLMRPQGYFSSTMDYDNNENLTIQKYYDLSENLVITVYGYAEIHKEYDSKHQVIKECYFDTEGNPTTRIQGYSSTTMEYDDEGTLIAQNYYDINGKPIDLTTSY